MVYAIPGEKGYSENFPELATLKANPKVEVIDKMNITEINGADFVTGVKLQDGRTIHVDGVFILLEHVSTSNILADAGVDTDEGGCVLTDRHQQTNIPGVYAAGDCSCVGWQVVTAAGDGAKAALAAMKYLKKRPEHD
jgi:thioredoxin reductase (NADPH)